MLSRLLRSEWMKIKRKGLWFLTILGPLGVIGLTMVNYGVRKDYLLSISDDDWQVYLGNILSLTPLALILGIVILTSMMASIENQTNAWKQWLSLPVRRSAVYLSKYLIASCLLLVSSVVLAVGTTLYGISLLGFGDPIPWVKILQISFYPWLASQALIAFHLWIAVANNNQGITVSVGVVGVVTSIVNVLLPDWFMWKWPTLANNWGNPTINVVLGISFGLLLFAVGMVHFCRKDVS